MLVVMALAHFRCKALGFRGGRVAQLMREDLDSILFSLALLAHVTVGANRKAMQRGCAFLCPLGEGLRQQRQARHQKQDTLALAGLLLGDFQAGEGLAGATGHDELAACGFLKPFATAFKAIC